MGCSLASFSWDFPDENTSVGCHCLLRDLLTRGPDPSLLFTGGFFTTPTWEAQEALDVNILENQQQKGLYF